MSNSCQGPEPPEAALRVIALSRASEQLLRQAGFRNREALALYERMGFRVEAVRVDYYEQPREDALVLWCRAWPPADAA